MGSRATAMPLQVLNPVIGRTCNAMGGFEPDCKVIHGGGTITKTGIAPGYPDISLFSSDVGFATATVPTSYFSTSVGQVSVQEILVADTGNSFMRKVGNLPEKPSSFGEPPYGGSTSTFLGTIPNVIDLLFFNFASSATTTTQYVLIVQGAPKCYVSSQMYALPILGVSAVVGAVGSCSFKEGVAGSGTTSVSRVSNPKSICGPSFFPPVHCGKSAINALHGNAAPVTGCFYIVDNKMLLRVRGSYPNSKLVWTSVWFAGSTSGVTGCMDGPASTARFSNPTGSALAPDGLTVYVADGGCKAIRAINTTNGMVSTFVGGCTTNCPSYPWADGVGTAAVLSGELGQMQIAPDGTYLYFTDATANRVRAVEVATRRVFTIAGNSTWAPPVMENNILRAAPGYKSGNGSTTVFNRINGIAMNKAGDQLYTTEKPKGIVRSIFVVYTASATPTPTVSTTPTMSNMGQSDLVISNFAGKEGQSKYLTMPFGPPLAYGGSGVGCLSAVTPRNTQVNAIEFVGADASNFCIKHFSKVTGMSILAGTCGQKGYVEKPPILTGNLALFGSASGLAFMGPSGTGDLLVSDFYSNCVRRINMTLFVPKVNQLSLAGTPTVTVSTFAGQCTFTDPRDYGGYKDGIGTNSRFSSPTYLRRHTPSGKIILVDSQNYVLRLLKADGSTQLLAGTPGVIGNKDGGPNVGRLGTCYTPTDEYNGNIYLVCSYGYGGFLYAIEFSTGIITKLLGTTTPSAEAILAGAPTAGAYYGYANGGPNFAQLPNPTGVILDPNAGVLYISDYNAANVRSVDLATMTISLFIGRNPVGNPPSTPITGYQNGSLSIAKFM
jgi:hypothetical protein